jgi:hypothetical protein
VSPLAVELIETLRQIGPASLREVVDDYERRARLGLVIEAERLAIDEAWSEAARAGRVKLHGGSWEWVPERRVAATAGRTQRGLFGG